MKISLSIITLFLSSLVTSSAIATADFAGHLRRNANGVSIRLDRSHKIYRLTASTVGAREVVQRLTDSDFIRGNGQIRGDHVIVDSIDFIGLKSLLGTWNLSGATLTFHDFKNATFASVFENIIYTYSLAPGEDQVWRILISNGRTVEIGHLEIQRNKLTVQFVDSKSGELKKALELTRERSSKP